jgi:hypothetical protein
MPDQSAGHFYLVVFFTLSSKERLARVPVTE